MVALILFIVIYNKILMLYNDYANCVCDLELVFKSVLILYNSFKIYSKNDDVELCEDSCCNITSHSLKKR